MEQQNRTDRGRLSERWFRSSSRRLNWKYKEPQEDDNVVKGTSHRVIVVKSPDKRYFKEAIFIVRDDIFRESGANEESVLREARKIANSYMGRLKTRRNGRTNAILRLPVPIFAAGAAVTGIAWLTARLCGL